MNNEHTVAPKTTLQSLKEEARKEWELEEGVDYPLLDTLIEKAFAAGKEEAVGALMPYAERASKEKQMINPDWLLTFLNTASTNNPNQP